MKNFLSHCNIKSFSTTWRPRMPKHKIIIEKTTYRSPHPVWDMKDAENVEICHVEPKNIKDKISFGLVKLLRTSFDFFSRFKPGIMNEKLYLRRCIFLETMAGVPGNDGRNDETFKSPEASQRGWLIESSFIRRS